MRIAASVELDVRFHEVDAQGVVWHGNYLHYLDLARWSLLGRGGLTASELRRSGHDLETVDFEVHYRAPLRLDDRARVETELTWPGSAELDFEYRVVRVSDGVVAATARTKERLVDASGAPVAEVPAIVREWEKRTSGS